MDIFHRLVLYLTELRPKFDPDSAIAFEIFNHPVRWYAIIILTGALIVALYGYYRFAKPLGVNSDTVFTGFVLGLFFGILGARLYYVIFDASNGGYYANLWEVIYPGDGGLAIHGGVIGAAIFVIIYCKIKHVKLIYIFEIVMPLIMFAQVVGRWGNFANQEAFGGLVKVAGLNINELTSTTVLPDNILQAQRDALSHLLVPKFIIDRMYVEHNVAEGWICPGYYYPTFYFESLANLFGLTVYMIVRKYWKKVVVGDGISFYLIWYGIVRFFIETMRTDPLVIGNTGIKIAEVVSGCCIVAGLAFMIIRRIVKYKMIPCKEALYSKESSLMEEGYETPIEPYFFEKIINFFKKKKHKNSNNEDTSNEDQPGK